MSWNPIRDIRKTMKKLEDSVNQDVFDDVLGVQDLGRFAMSAGIGGPQTALTRSNTQRNDAKVDRARVQASEAERKAQEARDLPTVLANQARARRRQRQRESSLMSAGAPGGDTSALLSSAMAYGKPSLGA